VVFDANTSRAILNYFGECVNGLAVVRGTTFLSGKLGERVASSRLSVVNDPTFPELLGTYPFDDEGTSGRRTIIVHEGILQNYLLNSYAARRLGMPSTGSAGRGLGGKAFVIQANFHAIPGSHTETSLVRDAKTGLYITELLGHGLNAQTGDFSIGAAGFYIEHGEIVYPVSGFAIAGNFGVLLRNIDGVGNELKPNGPTASPPLLVSGLTVSGR
jgi:PmbA protein